MPKTTNTERQSSVQAAVGAWLATPGSRARRIGAHALYWEILKAFDGSGILSAPFPVDCHNFALIVYGLRQYLKHHYGARCQRRDAQNIWFYFPAQASR